MYLSGKFVMSVITLVPPMIGSDTVNKIHPKVGWAAFVALAVTTVMAVLVSYGVDINSATAAGITALLSAFTGYMVPGGSGTAVSEPPVSSGMDEFMPGQTAVVPAPAPVRKPRAARKPKADEPITTDAVAPGPDAQ